MKKLIILSLIFIGFSGVNAQSTFALTDGIPAMVYALPKTELSFEIEVETTVEKPGVFYLYSQLYLATNQVVMEEKVSVKIKKISMKTKPVPDTNRRFAIEPNIKSPMHGIVVNEQGLLCGFNISPLSAHKTHVNDVTNIEPETQSPLRNLLPLTQEYMMAGSTAKMAEGAARQIYDIRTSRLNLLSGEMDHLPDGEALKIMLKGLDSKENELTELFAGSVRKKTSVYKLKMIPDKQLSDEVFFRLSATRGVISKDDLSGEPYFISISSEKIQKKEKDPKNKEINTGLYTVLPAMTTITIGNGVEQILHETIQLPQFGELVLIPESFLSIPGISVHVDCNTGRLLNLKK